MTTPIDQALWGLRLVHFAAAMLVFGGASFDLYAPRCGRPATFARQLGRLSIAAATAALLSALALLLCHAAAMAGSPAAALDPGTISAVLLYSWFGRVWSLHLALAVGLVLCCWRGWRKPTLILSLGLLASLGWVGHSAIGEGFGGVMREFNQSLHLLAAGLWLGGLVPLGWLLVRARDAADDAAAAAARRALARFSRIGYAAVGIIALTGLVNSLLLVSSLRLLAGTLYGRLLVLKILLFGLLVALALLNRFRLAPRIARERGALTALCRTVVLEQGLGVAILAVVSILGTLTPALE